MFVCMYAFDIIVLVHKHHISVQAIQNIVLAILTGVIYLQLEDDANALINRSDIMQIQ